VLKKKKKGRLEKVVLESRTFLRHDLFIFRETKETQCSFFATQRRGKKKYPIQQERKNS
jgi:hypothetical protein